MGSNRLKMDPDKTQIIWLGSWQQLAALNVEPLRLHDGTVVQPPSSVHNLGIVFDNEMSIAEQHNSQLLLSPAAVAFHPALSDPGQC